jgi:hypothetical protein
MLSGILFDLFHCLMALLCIKKGNQSINQVHPPHIDSTKATKESPPEQNGKPYDKINVT